MSRERFGELADAARHTLWLIAFGMTNDRHTAEDLAQESLAIAWKKVDRFDPATSFTAWTAAIVRNLALNHRRNSAHRPRAASQRLEDAPSKATRSRGVPIDAKGHVLPDQEHFDDRVLAALGGLSEQARSCLLLRTVKGLSYEAISQLLQVPPGTAMSHVHRARKAMRKALGREAAGPKGEVA